MASKVLLTWYGITDLRAAFGFEADGPISGAMRAERYDEVVVLGYSDEAKQTALNTFDDSILRHALADVANGGDPATRQLVVGRFSNTRQAHKFFCEWLRGRLTDLGRDTKLSFRPVHLSDLNDTDGIYEAAVAALQSIAEGDDAPDVTLFLSPGTPVMAFVWALAALNFPRVKKRLISSSRPGNPPESIRLPDEWLEWNTRRRCTAPLAERKAFDMIFHLFGEQRLPSYWGMSQYVSRYHVFVRAKGYDPAVLAPYLNGGKPLVLTVDAFDPEDVRTKILRALVESKAPPTARIGFNLTGGTNLMYAGAMAACRKVNGTPFYFAQETNSVIDLLTLERTPIKPILSVEPFLGLSGSDIRIDNFGHWEQIPDIHAPRRAELTEFLWRNKSVVAGTYKEVVSKTDRRRQHGSVAKKNAYEGRCPFTYSTTSGGQKANKRIEMASEWDETANFTLGASHFKFDHFPYFAKYITGGWFEEYVYTQLKPLEEEGLIFDLRLGLTLSIKTSTQNSHSGRRMEDPPFQEFDILFTDGSRLYIVECKAGQLKSDHVSKLSDEVRLYGRIGGRGILVACLPQDTSIISKRIEKNRSLRLVTGSDITRQIRAIVKADRKPFV